MRDAAIQPGATDEVKPIVSKDTVVAVRGYLKAVERLHAAGSNPPDHADDFFAALFEAANWFASIVEQQLKLAALLEEEAGDSIRAAWEDTDADAVIFARNRMYHHWASVAEYDAGASEHWTWRPAELLPEPDPRFAKKDAERKPAYDSQLGGRPVMDVFDRLSPRVVSLAPHAGE
jgi:hypothetical protein